MGHLSHTKTKNANTTIPELMPTKSYHIVIVDDDETITAVISKLLEIQNYTVTVFNNGRHCIDFIENSNKPDLILLDVFMPRISGFEVCEKIRKHFTTNELPIIMLTGSSESSNLIQGFSVGANDYLIKPVSEIELLARVKTQIDLTQLHRKLKEANLRLEDYAQGLEENVRDRTAALKSANDKLRKEINERLRTQKALFEAKEAAEAANHAKTEFLESMSHELRTPLNGIIGMLQTIQRSQEKNILSPDILRDLVSDSIDSARLLESLIGDVLDITRIEQGHLNLSIKPVCIKEIMDGLNSNLELQAKNKGLQFIISIQDQLPSVHADSIRLSQVLINLIGNSIKFTDKGFIRVEAKPYDNTHIEIKVIDTGCGIEEKNLGIIFNRFERVEKSGSKPGTGLGLTITKRLLEMMNGTIWVESKVGLGSTFTCLLQSWKD